MPPPLSRDYNRDRNLKALKRRGLLFIMGLHYAGFCHKKESLTGVEVLAPYSQQDKRITHRTELLTCEILHISLLPTVLESG